AQERAPGNRVSRRRNRLDKRRGRREARRSVGASAEAVGAAIARGSPSHATPRKGGAIMPVEITTSDNGAGAAARPRAAALVGPYGSGKSSLFEALMAAAGTPIRRSGDARSRTMSSEITLGHCRFMGDPWSILDCPGSIEFSYETSAAL